MESKEIGWVFLPSWILVGISFGFALADIIVDVTNVLDPKIIASLSGMIAGVSFSFVLRGIIPPSKLHYLLLLLVSFQVIGNFFMDSCAWLGIRYMAIWLLIASLMQFEIIMTSSKEHSPVLAFGKTFKIAAKPVSAILSAIIFFMSVSNCPFPVGARMSFFIVPVLVLSIFLLKNKYFTKEIPIEGLKHALEPRNVAKKPKSCLHVFLVSLFSGCIMMLYLGLNRLLAINFGDPPNIFHVISLQLFSIAFMFLVFLTKKHGESGTSGKSSVSGSKWIFVVGLFIMIFVPWVLVTLKKVHVRVAGFAHLGAIIVFPLMLPFIGDVLEGWIRENFRRNFTAMNLGSSLGVVIGIAGIFYGAENYQIGPGMGITFSSFLLIGGTWIMKSYHLNRG
ncbi:hypothetical protein GF325_01365 [Candidatus Bathyarchaeota archaeon]|nr:hypothetical protein [Candidatus Bathyarchaeota archaeon]